MAKLPLLDRMIATVSPAAALRRHEARTRLQRATRGPRMLYDAAAHSHRTEGWRPVATDVVGEIRTAGPALRGRSRDLIRNNAYAARAKRAVVANVIGAGIIPSIESPNLRTVEALEKRLREHFDTPACDYTGRLDLYGLQSLIMGTLFESGEVLIRKRLRRAEDGLPLPFQLHVLEPDFLDDLVDGPMYGGDNFAIQGVEFNKDGHVVAYHLFKEHPGTTTPHSTERERVPADMIIHAFDVVRPGQVRGVPWLAPVMLRLLDFGRYTDATLIKQQVAASYTAFVTSDQPDMQSVTTEGEDGATSTNERPLEYTEPGTIKRLLPGESIEFPSAPPTTDFAPYAVATLREIAAGIGISYEALSGDLSGVNFSSGRMGWLEFQRNIDTWRLQLLQPQVLSRVAVWFLGAARISQGVSGSVEIKWTPPRREMVSMQEEVPATVKLIRAGLMSRSEAIRKLGYDPALVDAEIAEDNQRADALGLILDTDPRQRTDYGQEAEPSANNNDAESPTEGGERRNTLN